MALSPMFSPTHNTSKDWRPLSGDPEGGYVTPVEYVCEGDLHLPQVGGTHIFGRVITFRYEWGRGLGYSIVTKSEFQRRYTPIVGK